MDETEKNEAAEAEGAPEDLSSGADTGSPDWETIMEIPLELSVELGRKNMLIKDLLLLSQGSVVELDKLAGEPLEIYVNRKLVAKGEVVVMGEKFAVRLTDIITPIERVRSLT